VQVDDGRFAVTKSEADRFVFKVPVLRNVAMTPPYFHDGSVDRLVDAVTIMAKVQLARDLPPARPTTLCLPAITDRENAGIAPQDASASGRGLRRVSGKKAGRGSGRTCSCLSCSEKISLASDVSLPRLLTSQAHPAATVRRIGISCQPDALAQGPLCHVRALHAVFLPVGKLPRPLIKISRLFYDYAELSSS